MAPFWSTVLGVLSCLMLVSRCEGDACNQAQNSLMMCFMQNELDYERLTDPSYIPELCRVARKLLDCTDEARDVCPTMALLQGEMVNAIAQMQQQVNSYCGEEHSDDCPNPAQDVIKCAGIVQGMNEFNLCSKGEQYLSCLRTVQEACKDHPMLDQIPMDSAFGTITDVMDNHCQPPQSTTTTPLPEEPEDDSDDSDDNDDDNDDNDDSSATVNTCTRLESKFYDQLQACSEILYDNLSGTAVQCRALLKVRTCVKKLMLACRKRDWMTEVLVTELSMGLNRLRELEVYHQCPQQTT